MNTKTIIMALMLFASVPFFADAQSDVMTLKDGSRYEGAWPAGEGVLYSYDQGLVFGTFVKGKPDGRCVCYRPSGEVYWGDYKKGKATGKGRIYRDNGIVISGDYKNGVIMESILFIEGPEPRWSECSEKASSRRESPIQRRMRLPFRQA